MRLEQERDAEQGAELNKYAYPPEPCKEVVGLSVRRQLRRTGLPKFKAGDRVEVPQYSEEAPIILLGKRGTVLGVSGAEGGVTGSARLPSSGQSGPGWEFLYDVRFDGEERVVEARESWLVPQSPREDSSSKS